MPGCPKEQHFGGKATGLCFRSIVRTFDICIPPGPAVRERIGYLPRLRSSKMRPELSGGAALCQLGLRCGGLSANGLIRISGRSLVSDFEIG